MKPNPHQKNLRKGRYSQQNQIYHITTSTLNRAPIFKDFYVARKLIKTLKTSDEINHTNTLAFVVMPDHIHWLFQLNQKQSLPQLIQGIKSISARQFGKPVWQAGYYDHAIRKDEDVIAIARYVIANPIRAGLVKRLGDYPHWHAIWV